jgi:hypothetical protein
LLYFPIRKHVNRAVGVGAQRWNTSLPRALAVESALIAEKLRKARLRYDGDLISRV